MKYPKEQFNVLVSSLKKLSVCLDIKNGNPTAMHYMIYQQFSKGQTHNWLYICPDGIERAHKIQDLSNCEKLLTTDYNFELYPEGCDDTHIETAMKRAIKEVCINDQTK